VAAGRRPGGRAELGAGTPCRAASCGPRRGRLAVDQEPVRLITIRPAPGTPRWCDDEQAFWPTYRR
jgi:hypothetical protein